MGFFNWVFKIAQGCTVLLHVISLQNKRPFLLFSDKHRQARGEREERGTRAKGGRYTQGKDLFFFIMFLPLRATRACLRSP